MRKTNLNCMFAALCAFSTAGVAAQQDTPATSERAVVTRQQGLATTRVTTPNGSITVYLPDDMRAGDTISGTVVAEPNGNTDTERHENMDRLQGIVVDVAGTKSTAKNPAIRFVIPAAATTAALVVRDGKGAVLYSAEPTPVTDSTGARPFPAPDPIPNTKSGSSVRGFNPNGPEPYRRKDPPPTVQSGKTNKSPNDNGPEPYRLFSPNPAAFRLPLSTQAGRPIPITGPFDGDASNTSATYGGRPAEILAESPRQAIVRTENLGPGQHDLRVTDQGRTVSGACNCLTLRLSAPKTTLKRGERTTISVKVEGLAGLPDEAFPLQCTLRNTTPEVINLNGSDTASWRLTPKNAGTDGACTFTANATGIRAGTFTLAAEVSSMQARGPGLAAVIDMKKIKTEKNLEGYSEQDLTDTLKDLRDRKQFDKDHGNEYQDWLKKKINLVKKALKDYHGIEAPDDPIDD